MRGFPRFARAHGIGGAAASTTMVDRSVPDFGSSSALLIHGAPSRAAAYGAVWGGRFFAAVSPLMARGGLLMVLRRYADFLRQDAGVTAYRVLCIAAWMPTPIEVHLQAAARA